MVLAVLDCTHPLVLGSQVHAATDDPRIRSLLPMLVSALGSGSVLAAVPLGRKVAAFFATASTGFDSTGVSTTQSRCIRCTRSCQSGALYRTSLPPAPEPRMRAPMQYG